MKYIFAFPFLMVLFFSACSTSQKKEINLTDRAVIKADLKLIDFENHKVMKPSKVYFIKLSTNDNYISNRIILSDEKDSEGNIYINPEPGIYAIVATERFIGSTLIRTILNDETIALSKVEVLPGETKTVKLRILDYTSTIFDTVPKLSKHYQKVLKAPAIDLFMYKIGKFEKEPSKVKEDSEKVKEEAVIEKY